MPHTELVAAILVHLDALYNLAMWLTRESTEAQALVQTTLRQALQMTPGGSPATKLRVRLLTLMWATYCRQQAMYPDGVGPDAAQQVPAEKRGLLHTLSRADLDAAVRQLPEALRAAVILSDMEGYTLEEVAAILDWTREQVQTALMQARRLLSQVLQVRLTSTQAWPAVEGKDPQ